MHLPWKRYLLLHDVAESEPPSVHVCASLSAQWRHTFSVVAKSSQYLARRSGLTFKALLTARSIVSPLSSRTIGDTARREEKGTGRAA